MDEFYNQEEASKYGTSTSFSYANLFWIGKLLETITQARSSRGPKVVQLVHFSDVRDWEEYML